MRKLSPKPLNPESFAPYGDVIEIQAAKSQFEINFGLANRFHDVAKIDVESTSADAGRVGFSLLTTQATPLPLNIKVMEYHPLGSQLFYPSDETPFLVLVAPPAKTLDVNQLELFITDGKQGVNYNKGTWHHYLLPILKEGQDNANFIIVDRLGTEKNCIEAELKDEVLIQL